MRLINRGAEDFVRSGADDTFRSRAEVLFRSGSESKTPGLQIQFVHIGLALAAALYREQPPGLQRFEVRAHAAIGQAEILCEPLLARKTIVVLPRVAEQ